MRKRLTSIMERLTQNDTQRNENNRMGKMKVRVGFVSNSSSVSFCVYGIWIDHPQEELRDIAEKMGLFCHGDQYGDGIYIGREWSKISDDETGKQFKEVTQEKIDKLPIDNKKCATHEEGWWNG